MIARGQRCADRVHAGYEFAVRAEHVDHLAAHAGHDAHVGHDVGRVGDLDADLCDVRAKRAHAERDHVHRAPADTAVEQPVQDPVHLARFHPIVGGAGVVFVDAADVRAILDACDVAGIGEGEEAVGALFLVQSDVGAGFDETFAQLVVLFLRAVAPMNCVRLAQGRHFVDPVAKLFVLEIGRIGNHGRHLPLIGSGTRLEFVRRLTDSGHTAENAAAGVAALDHPHGIVFGSTD